MAGGDDDGAGAADIALVDIGSLDLDAGEVLGFGEEGPWEQFMASSS